MITNLFKATIGVALTPIALVVDLACVPSDAYEGCEFAPRTREVINTTKEHLRKALK